MENFSVLFLAAALRQVILSTPSKTQLSYFFLLLLLGSAAPSGKEMKRGLPINKLRLVRHGADSRALVGDISLFYSTVYQYATTSTNDAINRITFLRRCEQT